MKLSTLGAVTAAFAVCAAAGAQTTVDPQTSARYEQIGVGLRLGVFLPTDESTSGTAVFGFGADYRLGLKTPRVFGLESNLALSVDYQRRDEVGNIPILLNYVGRSGQYFFHVGAGVGFATLPQGDTTVFSYAAGVGYTLPVNSTLPLFVQATFFGADHSRVNGVGLFAGIRF